MSLDLDFAGRMKKIRAPAGRALQAVFEAVANSFDATESLGTAGKITVRIRREIDKSLFKEEKPSYRLTGYEIEDNGIGFTDQNMTSFQRSDSTHKKDGKGVGRLLWLKVFDTARVVSTFEDKGVWRKRDFPFSVEKGGVDETDIVPQDTCDRTPTTTIHLINPKRDLVSYLTQDPKTLAAKLLEHFLLYFTVLTGPTITIECDHDPEPVDVWSMYRESFIDRHKVDEIIVNDFEFQLHHLFVKPTTARKNLVRLCARRRVVKSENISVLLPEVSTTQAVTTDNNYRYHAYVTGTFFDENADDERSDIRFASGDSAVDEQTDPCESTPLLQSNDEGDEGSVTREQLFTELATRIGEHLKDHIAEVRGRKERQLESFAQQMQPQFRPFVAAAKQKLDRLPARPSHRDIELALYEAKIDGREELERAVDEIVKRSEVISKVEQAKERLVERFAAEANRQSMSTLAEYVCTRKAVINVLKASLKKHEGEYDYESTVHDLFFPRHTTSNEIPVGPTDGGDRDIENLWLLDERLVFHKLLTSDKPLSTLKRFMVGGSTVVADVSQKNDEPDILVFEPAFVTAEDHRFESLAIIEFKRPGRDDYTLAKNPIQQVIEIARKIRNSQQVEAVTGEIQPIAKSVRFYGYVVCDITGTLRPIIEDSFSMKHTPDGVGYYAFNDNLNLLIEVIPYAKIVSDAERRNAAFFHKLGM